MIQEKQLGPAGQGTMLQTYQAWNDWRNLGPQIRSELAEEERELKAAVPAVSRTLNRRMKMIVRSATGK